MALSAISKIILKIMRKRGVRDGKAFAKKLGFEDDVINIAVKHNQKWKETFLPLAPAKSTAKTLGETQLPGKIGKRRIARNAREKAFWTETGGREFAGSGLWKIERKRAARIKKQKPDVRKRMEQRISDAKWQKKVKDGTIGLDKVPAGVLDRITSKAAPGIEAKLSDRIDKYTGKLKTRKVDKMADEYYYPKPATRKTLEQKSELATTKALPTLAALRGRGAAKAAKDPLSHLAERNNAMEREVTERMRGYTPGSIEQTPGVKAEKGKVMDLLRRVGLIK